MQLVPVLPAQRPPPDRVVIAQDHTLHLESPTAKRIVPHGKHSLRNHVLVSVSCTVCADHTSVDRAAHDGSHSRQNTVGHSLSEGRIPHNLLLRRQHLLNGTCQCLSSKHQHQTEFHFGGRYSVILVLPVKHLRKRSSPLLSRKEKLALQDSKTCRPPWMRRALCRPTVCVVMSGQLSPTL